MTPASEYTVAFGAGVSAAVFTFRQILMITRDLRNGPAKQAHCTLEDDPEMYWQRMRENVTEPLGEILERQTKVLDEQVKGNAAVMQKLILLEERTGRFRRDGG